MLVLMAFERCNFNSYVARLSRAYLGGNEDWFGVCCNVTHDISAVVTNRKG